MEESQHGSSESRDGAVASLKNNNNINNNRPKVAGEEIAIVASK